MTYHNAIKYIKSAPDSTPAEDSSKTRVTALLSALGDPQKKIKYLRLAGNNGKSVCAQMLTSILNEAKICNGSLTMPLHEDLRENVKVNGAPLSIDETVRYTEQVAAAAASVNENAKINGEANFTPTAREIMLCIALLQFVAKDCKLALIECDHNTDDPSRFLPVPLSAVICGAIPSEDTEEIAKIRSYVQRGINEITSVPQDQGAYTIIAQTCHSVNCRLTISMPQNAKISAINLRGTTFTHKGQEYTIRICGRFQVANAILAIESAEMLTRNGYSISKENVKKGLLNVVLPSKFEIISISPTIIIDSTHSPIAIETVSDSMAEFKHITGNKVRLCLPYGELCEQYVSALEARGYEIESIIAYVQANDTLTEASSHPLIPCKSIKQTVKAALSNLTPDSLLLASGTSDFSDAIRYEALASLGF
jgi:dihydrofolate synthase/folylpolyglutamate synthase